MEYAICFFDGLREITFCTVGAGTLSVADIDILLAAYQAEFPALEFRLVYHCAHCGIGHVASADAWCQGCLDDACDNFFLQVASEQGNKQLMRDLSNG